MPPPPRELSHGVSAGLGVLLLTAAGLKLYGLNVSPFAQYGWFTAPAVQMAAVLWEVVLGLWLLSGANRVGAWLAAVGTFLAFAAVSGYLGGIGQASCGCFGMIQASPWWAFGVDVSALVLLALTRPDWRTESPRTSPAFARILFATGLLLVVLTVSSTVLYGSPAAAISRLQGEPLYTPGYLDFGSAQAGTELQRSLSVTNWSDEPVRLIGGTSDCSCITTAKMPLTIAPDETVAVPIQLRVPGSSRGAFTRRVELWTDCDERRTLSLTLGCRVE